MSWHRIVPIIALLSWLSPLVGCKKKTPPPKELASLKPEQACKHFFGRVKTCSASINRIKADKLGLKGAQRAAYLRQVGKQLSQAFSNLDLVCERYAVKTRKQQTDMDRCYQERTCDAFGQCFVQMADAEATGFGGMGAGALEELRKQIRALRSKQPPDQGMRPDGAPHGRRLEGKPKKKPMSSPKGKPKPTP